MTKISDTVVDPNRGIRNTIVVLSILISLLGLVWAAGNVWVLLILILNSLALISMAMIMYPYVVLREDGVAVRFFFKEQFYRWDQILQAGRYRTEYKKQPHPLYFSLVLVGPNGSEKKSGRDKSFLRRNFCKAISLPNDRTVRLFVEKCFGPLDFDDYNDLTAWEIKANKLDET